MSRVLLVLSALLLSCAAVASAQVPSPTQSTVDPCLIICPRGDFAFHVTVRDIAGAPISGSSVSVDFCPVSPTIHLCPPLVVCTLQGVTGPSGQVAFAIAGGGVTSTNVSVTADGVVLAQLPVASPDQNGDLVVSATDVGIASGWIGMVNRTVDLDCDQGTVDAQDVAVVQAHLGHACDSPTSTDRSSWGQLKTMYR